jgi:hypothetical protein
VPWVVPWEVFQDTWSPSLIAMPYSVKVS